MPERLPYDEAMLFSAVRLRISDPELKQGQVEKVTIQTSAGIVERPWGIEGGFAVVYKFRTKSGKHRALRCFRVPMDPDTQFRYERIGPYFHTHAPDITADFNYHDTGIMVADGLQKQVYPVIEMDWIDGVTLLEKVDELCKKRDHLALKDLSEQWLNILNTLRRANISHGDLAGVNVMVRVDGKLILIDYDGVYIPEFVGLRQILLGQRDYQHPQMVLRQFNERTDDFSALVIYTALLALKVRPELWDTYVKRDAQGKLLDANILFTQEDFKVPYQSALMQELELLGDPQVKAAVQELQQMCVQSVDQVQFPLRFIDPDYEKKLAFEQLEAAIRVDDDEQIVDIWFPLLEQYAKAQHHRSRVQLAQQRVNALLLFRNALKGQNIQRIASSYDSILDSCKNVTKDERTLLSFARSFIQASQMDDDDVLVDITDTMQKMGLLNITFTVPEQECLTLARQRKKVLKQLQTALKSQDIESIAVAYNPVQNTYKGLSQQERQQAELASNFVRAYHSDTDEAIITAYDAIQNSKYRSLLSFTTQQQRRAALAKQRTEALARFRVALTSKSIRRIASAYDAVLDTSKNLSPEERDQLHLAQALVQAYDADDDEALIAAYEAIKNSTYHTFFAITTEEQQRIERAKQCKFRLNLFRDALQSKLPRKVDLAYHPILDASKNLTQEERSQLALARRFMQGYDNDDDETLFDVGNALRNRDVFIFSVQEQQRLDLAKQRYLALLTFRKALSENYRDPAQLVAAYDAELLDTSRDVTQEQRTRVELAHRYLQMYRQTKAALDAKDEDAIRQAYKKSLGQEFVGFTHAEQEIINTAIEALEKKLALEEALKNRESEKAIRMAKSIVRETRKEIYAELVIPLKKASMQFMREQDLKDLEVSIEENIHTGINRAVARWRWPANDLVGAALLVWSTDTFPRNPQESNGHNDALILRKSSQGEGMYEFSIGPHTHIYVQVYAAIYDAWDQANMQWRYSRGYEPTSRCEVGSSQMIWRRYG